MKKFLLLIGLSFVTNFCFSQCLIDERLSELFLDLPINLDPIETNELIKKDSNFLINRFDFYEETNFSFLEASFKGNTKYSLEADSIFFERHTYSVGYRDSINETQVKLITVSKLSLIYPDRKTAIKNFNTLLNLIKVRFPIEHYKKSDYETREMIFYSLFFTGNEDFEYLNLSCQIALKGKMYKIIIEKM